MCDNSTDKWHVGERCFAPSENGELCKAIITSFETDENGDFFAIISFNDAQEKKILVEKLCRIKTGKDLQKNLMFDNEDLEKPYFPDRGLPSLAVAFELSKDGYQIPYTVNRYLRDYQREGAQFLHGHYVRKNGCILGDDMGLGKTVQVISFLAAVLHKKGTRADIENNLPDFLLRVMNKEKQSLPTKTFLIVAPLSVLYNWKDELDTWGYFKVIVLYGNRKVYELSRIKQGKCEIVLTTYETVRLFLDDLNSIEWSAVIVDEVHRIKNPKSKITQAMKALVCKVRLGLTGTILQNNMKDLWCVMDWAVPGLLGNEKRFKKEFSDPVEHGQRHTATKRELATGRKAMQRLAKKMTAYFLRRTKTLISDQLPRKEDRIVYCSLTEFQRAIYKAVLETEDVHLVLQACQRCSCNSGHKRKNCCYKTNAHGETMQGLFFSYLIVLRKIANHVALLQTDNTSKQQEAHITSVCSEVFSKFPDFVQLSEDAAFKIISDPKYSGKMKVLQKLLNHFRRNKDKVLLFSFSTKLLDVLEQYCMASGLDYRRLDGNTKAEDRVKIVKEFNCMEEVNICLVSTMAGGLGLNFVGANIVVLFDPTWNPANDLQAIDRVYRIGQCRNVKVFRLISLGTVEEIMYLRQVYKQQLHCAVVGSENAKRYFEAVQGSKEHQGELFGIHNLLKFRDCGSCLTKEILEREGRVEAGVMTTTMWLKEELHPDGEEMQGEYRHEGQDSGYLKQPMGNEGFDCSDFSDEEPMQNSKMKAERSRSGIAKNTKLPQGQLSLLQCGFPQLLEKRPEPAGPGECVAGSCDESIGGTSVGQRSIGCCSRDGSLKTEDHNSTSGHQKGSVSAVRTGKQKVYNEIANWDSPFSSRTEQKKDTGKQQESVCISDQDGIVMETEGSSTESEDTVFPSQVSVGQEILKSYKDTAASHECLDAEESLKHTPVQGHLISEQNGRSMLLYNNNKPFENVSEIKTVEVESDLSDESDDIEITKPGKQEFTSIVKEKQFRNKQLNLSTMALNRSRSVSADTQSIDEFSSPEDNFSTKEADVNKLKLKSTTSRIQFKSTLPRYGNNSSVTLRKQRNSNSYQLSFSKQTFASQGQNDRSLDIFLGDVAEVSYVHSNQNVVGSSKAENQMSRWAVRDVFELQQFSQLPANIAVCRAKKDKKNREEISSKKNTHKINLVSGISKPSVLYITHPVCQKQKRVHQIGSRTFLLGKTPKRIRRKQFEEMASHFHKNPVEELAKHIAQATSEERQKMLKEFYGAKYPDLKELLKVDASEGSNKGDLHRPQSNKRKSVFRPEKSNSGPLKDECSQKKHDAEEERFQQNPCIQTAVSHNVEDKQLSTVIAQDSIRERNSQAFKDFMASDSINCKSGVIEGLPANATKGQPNLKGTESPRKPFLSPLASRQAQLCKKNSFTDLLGDTSILNDLFKSNENRLGEPPGRSLSAPIEKAKTRPKDFWDMLNEQNEESLQKLTDMATLERLCEKDVCLSRKKEENEKPLWKKNDNFLWKRDNSTDTDDESLSHT